MGKSVKETMSGGHMGVERDGCDLQGRKGERRGGEWPEGQVVLSLAPD